MLRILSSGLYTSIQDLGRYEFQNYGVPISGAMDHYSMNLANALVGNAKQAAVIEMVLIGPKLKFEAPACISITGAHLSPKLNHVAVPLNTRLKVCKNDVLTFGRSRLGCRAYLAITGGFKSNLVMQSRSQYLGVTETGILRRGDCVPYEASMEPEASNAAIKVPKVHFNTRKIPVFVGPEFELLSAAQKASLFDTEFTVAPENSRMAYQLTEKIKNKLPSILTSLVLPGTVQLTPSGTLIVLMRDAQATGGYPRVLQVSETGINRLSQKFTGERFSFEWAES